MAATKTIQVFDEDGGGPNTASTITAALAATLFENGAIAAAQVADSAITAAKLAAGAVTGAKVAALADDSVAPQMDLLVATALADAAGNEDIVLELPAGQTFKIVDAWVEQATTGNVGNSYLVGKGASAIGAAIAGSVTDGAILYLEAIPAANKAANSFANGNTLRWAITRAGDFANGIGYVRLRRLT